jgi:hypothetical protein
VLSRLDQCYLAMVLKQQVDFFTLFCILDLTLCFAVKIFLKMTLCLLRLIISSFGILYIFTQLFLNKKLKFGFLACFWRCILIGLFLSFFLQKFPKMASFFLAGWGGFTLGLILNNTFAYKFIGGSAIGFSAFIVGFSLLMVIPAYYFFDHIIIQCTAIFGSFLAINGLGLVAGHYQNPFTIQKMIYHGTFDNIDPLYYAYLGGNIALHIIGCVVQYRHKKKYPNCEYEEKMQMRTIK